ncbi:MAG TPA: hypothetical protein DCY13_18785 [Verrucomicrobiales bacterium]|nr:hypothetical protein [Verrucomicrobiales bacterium]
MDEQPDANNARPTVRGATGLFRTVEGAILLLGLILAGTYLAVVVAGLRWFPEESRALLGMTATNIVLGRIAGLTLGFAGPLGYWQVVLANALIETIQVLLVYPLFVLSWQRLLEFRALRRFMASMRRAAERHQPRIQRYGAAGLFVFVWIPFWMTGPVVGSVLGFFLGLRPWFNLTVVLGGTWIAIACWAYLLAEVQEQAARLGRYVPVAIVAALILLVFLARWLHRRVGRSRGD